MGKNLEELEVLIVTQNKINNKCTQNINYKGSNRIKGVTESKLLGMKGSLEVLEFKFLHLV